MSDTTMNIATVGERSIKTEEQDVFGDLQRLLDSALNWMYLMI